MSGRLFSYSTQTFAGNDFCGDGCTSNCDAVAECGPDAAPGHEDCPLNVCCSKFGFCGSTDEFCGANCVGAHCGSPSIPSGVNSAVTSRLIGYYEVRSRQASGRACDPWYPDNIPAAGYTHLNYAFASIDPITFAVVPASDSDIDQYRSFTDLKQANPNLKTYISIGGWAFNDPPTQHVFSDMSSTEANRQAFANSLVQFLVTYGFDGVDIDWEYPVACERGGVPADTVNMVAMFRTVRTTFSASGHSFGLTFTAPSSYWYLQHFDLLGLLSYADWVNLMSYDLHGVWDAKDVFIGNIVQAHTNLTEIEQTVGLFQRVGVPLDRIVLGLGFYGRSFQLSDASCSRPGCPFNGPAPGGACTAADGTLSYAEIQDILTRGGLSPVYDTDAQVKYLVYDTDNWVSYDDKDTFTAKVNWAKGAGFGGLMIWSADQDDFR
ncbi:glycoside hydrolase superfamily [Cerioporus squamosus]|nr:glycoside hydrolase superfamily [Cerioporus squamosus]